MSFSRLRHGGLVLFSINNLRGRGHRQNLPDFLHAPRLSLNPITFWLDAAKGSLKLRIAAFNNLPYSRPNDECDGYAIGMCAAYKPLLSSCPLKSLPSGASWQTSALTRKPLGNTRGSLLSDDDVDIVNEYWFCAAVPDAATLLRMLETQKLGEQLFAEVGRVPHR